MKALIIGGAGFIGCNIAKRLMGQKEDVLVFDNLSRKGTQANLRWLQSLGPLGFFEGDIRRYEDLKEVFDGHPDIDVVYHMAAQVAVTTSVTDPREDFEINALGTFNVLEAIRLAKANPIVIFASTNKVYGGMEDVKIVEADGRYAYRDFPEGIPEDRFLDFHSPYGCSKGAADQYVRDYARIYGLRTVTFRQSCIYGYRQFGIEDQGWVAWFTIQAVLDRPVSIYGDGKQVRDMLFVEDLVDAYQMAIQGIETTSGKIYNLGGGPRNKMCLHDLIAYLESLTKRKLQYAYDDWRPGDQPVFVCNVDKARREFGWEPRTSPEEGVGRLFEWVSQNTQLFLQEGL
jgi:CDP-paratose 2-epimerase